MRPAQLVPFALCCLAAGCASLPAGIEAKPEELEACRQEGCSVWTDAELEALVKKWYLRGFLSGRVKEL